MSKILTTAIALTFLLNVSVAAADSTSPAGPKSKRTALAHSLLWTIAPITVGLKMMPNKHTGPPGVGLALLGLIFGPGTGHAYAGQMGKFWRGAAIRGLVASSSIALAAAIGTSSTHKEWQEGLGDAAIAVSIGTVGAIVCIVSAIRDIKSVGRSVDTYNSSHGFADAQIAPTYFANHRAPGLMLRLSF